MAWKEVIDKSSGKPYYFDPDTGETSWKKPGESKKKKKKKKSTEIDSDKAEADPKNWAASSDPKTGKTYYYNKVTKKTSWKKPGCMPDDSDDSEEEEDDDDDESDRDESDNEEEESDASSEEDVKPKKSNKKDEWVPTTDPKTGKTYWFHRKTKKKHMEGPIQEEGGRLGLRR